MGRLKALQPGLKIELNPLPPGDPEVELLTKAAAELFVLRPSQRAVRRREILRGRLAGDQGRWQAAARKVSQRRPQIAALAPDLIGLLVAWNKTAKLAEINRRKRLGASSSRFGVQRRGTTKRKSSFRSLAAFAFLFAVVMSAVMSSLNNDHNSSRKSWQPPEYFIPVPPRALESPSNLPPLFQARTIEQSAEKAREMLRKLHEHDPKYWQKQTIYPNAAESAAARPTRDLLTNPAGSPILLPEAGPTERPEVSPPIDDANVIRRLLDRVHAGSAPSPAQTPPPAPTPPPASHSARPE